MWSADVAALSVDGWQLNEDAVVMRSQRLVTNVPPDTVEQCRPVIILLPRRVQQSTHYQITVSGTSKAQQALTGVYTHAHTNTHSQH